MHGHHICILFFPVIIIRYNYYCHCLLKELSGFLKFRFNCEISEEHDVKTTLARLAVIDINFSIQVCSNARPSRRPSVKVVNQNGSVQIGEMAAEYFLGCALI